MITLCQLVDSVAWLEPQDHIKISVWDKSKLYKAGEYKDIELNIRNLAKYGDYWVSDLDIEKYKDEVFLSCLIWKD